MERRHDDEWREFWLAAFDQERRPRAVFDVGGSSGEAPVRHDDGQ